MRAGCTHGEWLRPILVAVKCLLATSALMAQTVSFTAGPSGLVVEPTIPKVMDQATSGNRMFVNQLRVLDLGGNGRPDILLIPGVPSVAPWVSAPMRLLRPSGAGALSDVTRTYFGNGALPSTGAAPEVVTADFNRDGKPDIFVAESGFDAPPFPGAVNMLLESTAGESYGNLSSTLPPIPDLSISATAADVNGDGILDIYVGTLATANPMAGPHLLMGKADGTFDRTSSTLPVWLAQWERSFTASLLVDVDNDGYPDLVLGRWRGGKIQSESLILLNDGHGDFSRSTPIFLPAGTFGSAVETLKIRSIDANGDGYPDLLFVNTGDNYVGGQIQLLINRRDGTFADETLARLGPRSTAPVGFGWDNAIVVDINGDGKPDIFLQSEYEGTGAPSDFAWINGGNGTFAPVAVSSLPPGSKARIVLVDANGDSIPDLVSPYYIDNGDLRYQTYFNTAVRIVPSEPLIVGATVGNAQAAIAFKPPVASGASAITGYAATCRSGALVAVATGAASPLTVTGLTHGKPYLCSVTATNANGTSMPSGSVPARTFGNFQGLWWNAPAESESGWGINLNHQGTAIFATWFTYGLDGKPTWFAVRSDSTPALPNTFTGNLYTGTGPPFNTVGAGTVVPVQVGTVTFTFTFTDSNTATFAYTLNGIAQTKTITREVFASPMPVCTFGAQTNVALATNYQDLWWNVDVNERWWGINLAHQGDTIYATWFTFAADGKVLWLVVGASKTAPSVYSGTMYRPTGGPPFNGPFNTAPVTGVPVGAATLTFADGNSATFAYNVDGVAQTKSITREVFAPPGTVCQ